MKIEFEKPSSTESIIQVATQLYQDKFELIPNVISDYLQVEQKKVLELLDNTFKTEKILSKGCMLHSTQSYFEECTYLTCTNKGIIFVYKSNINYDGKKKETLITHLVAFYPTYLQGEMVEFFTALNKFKKKEKVVNKISTVVRNTNGFYLKTFTVKKPKLKITDNYENIEELHGEVLKRLNKKNDKGIALFYGEPGCGKTNYIRYLLTLVKKTVIYLPPDMAGHISSPDFLPFLMDYPNSILVIEDAENIIKSRKAGGSQSIANLLNLGDGLLSDILNIQIVATFNCEFNQIDSALVRKGRLIAKHEFRKLSIEKGQTLSDKLGFKTTITKEMPLCDIYNQDTKSYSETKVIKKIGFDVEPVEKVKNSFTHEDAKKIKEFAEEAMQSQSLEDFQKSWKKLKGKTAEEYGNELIDMAKRAEALSLGKPAGTLTNKQIEEYVERIKREKELK